MAVMRPQTKQRPTFERTYVETFKAISSVLRYHADDYFEQLAIQQQSRQLEPSN
jgi:hypothetical protein